MTARMGNEADAAGMTKGMRLTAANGGMVRCMIFIAIRAKATVTVSATATFYETMVGGKADAGLPKDQAAEAKG